MNQSWIPLAPGEALSVDVFLRVKCACRPSINWATTAAEHINGLQVGDTVTVDVYAGEEQRLYLPLVLRDS